jgi:hypothetical protein
VMQAASNPYAQLLAVPSITTSPSPAVPFASGTTLTFAAPAPGKPATGVVLTITIVPAPVAGKAVPPLAAVTFNMTSQVATVSDLIAGIQGALSNAAGVLSMPSLASAMVRSCLSPFAPPHRFAGATGASLGTGSRAGRDSDRRDM